MPREQRWFSFHKCSSPLGGSAQEEGQISSPHTCCVHLHIWCLQLLSYTLYTSSSLRALERLFLFNSLQTGFQFRLSWGLWAGGLRGRFLYLPFGEALSSPPGPPCPLLGGQPGLRPAPFPIRLLSCQTSEQVVFPGHKDLSRRIQDKAGGAGLRKGVCCLGVSSYSPTISPWIEDLAVHLRFFFSCSIKWLWNDASLLRSPFSGSSGSGWSTGLVLVNDGREEVMCDVLEHSWWRSTTFGHPPAGWMLRPVRPLGTGDPQDGRGLGLWVSTCREAAVDLKIMHNVKAES